MKNKVCLFIMAMCLISVCFAQTTESLESDIHTSISNVKSYVDDLKSKLTSMEVISENKTQEIESLKKEKQEIEKSADEAIKVMEEYSTKILKQKEKLNRQAKILFIVFIIFLVKLILTIVLFYVKIKMGITIPYWLNVIL